MLPDSGIIWRPRWTATPSVASFRFLLKHRRVLDRRRGSAVLVAAACEVALPLVVEHVVNAVIARKSTSAIEILGLAMLGLAVGGTIAVLFQRLVLVRASARFDTDTLDFVTTRLLGLPMSYFATRRIGDIERRLSGVERSAGSSSNRGSRRCRPPLKSLSGW